MNAGSKPSVAYVISAVEGFLDHASIRRDGDTGMAL